MQTTHPTDAAQPAIDRNAVEALHNRAKELVLTSGFFGSAPNLRFFQGWLDVTRCLLHGKTGPLLAQRDASLGGYKPPTFINAAWAAMPDNAKNFTLAQVQEFLIAQGVEVSTDTVADSQHNEVSPLEDAMRPVVNGHDELCAVAADFDNSSGLHAASFGVVESPIVAQPPAPAEGTLPMRHLVVLDVEPASRPARASKPPTTAGAFSPAAAKLIEQIQAEARAQVLADLSAKDDFVLLLEHDKVEVEFDDRCGAYYLHTKRNGFAITLYRGRPDATAKYPQADGVWWGTEDRSDAHGMVWTRRIGGLVCNDFGDLVQVAA